MGDDSSNEAQSSNDATTSALSTIAKGGVWVFGGRIVKVVVKFSVQLAIARILGTALFGGVVIAQMINGVGSMIANLGLPEGVARNLSYYEDEPEKARGVLRAGYGISFVSSTTIAIVLIIHAPVVATQIFNDTTLTPLIRLIAIGLPITTIGGITQSAVKGARDPRLHVLVNQLLNPITQTVFVGAFLFAGFKAVGAVAGQVLSGVLGAIVAIWLGLRLLPISLRGPTESMHREMVEFSLPLMFTSGVWFLIGNVDTFLIGAFLSSSSVGVYNAAFSLQEIGFYLFYPITFLVQPTLSRLISNDKQREVARTYQVVAKWLTFAAFPLFFVTFLFPNQIIMLTFGQAYTSAATALRILIVVPMFLAIAGPTGGMLVAFGHTKTNFYINATATITNVIANVTLIPLVGIEGAAMASVGSYLIRDILFLVVLYRWYDIHPLSRPMIKPVSIAFLAVPVGLYLFEYAIDPSLPAAAAWAVVTAVVYPLLILRAGGVESADIEVLEQFNRSSSTDLTPVRNFLRRYQS